MRLFEIPGRNKPFGVQWRVDGQRKTEFFEKARDRDKRAGQIRKDKKAGVLAWQLTREEIQEYRTLKAAMGERPLAEVLPLLALQTRPVYPTVRVSVAGYLEEARKLTLRKELAEVTLAYKEQKLEAFVSAFGGAHVDRVTPEEIVAWIESLGFQSPSTFNTYRRVLHSFFESVLPGANPCARVPRRDDHSDEVGILEPAATQRLFEWVVDKEPVILGRLALEAFAGLRFSSASKLSLDDINFTEEGLSLPASKIKTRRRQYLDELPANLWEWLRVAKEDCWQIGEHDYRHRKCAAFKYAGVPHPRNCLRHSFATYHVALHKDAGWTARLLCHRNQQQLYTHYLGRATAKEGEAYFNVRPAT